MLDKEWRVLRNSETEKYEPIWTYFSTWYEHEMEHVKTHPLQSQGQAERIAGLLNTLDELECLTFIQLLRESNLWRD